MELDFYLSEMSVSDLHGGGITLQRILRDDLDGIGRFAHLSRGADDFPPTEPLRSRSQTILPPLVSNFSRKWIGCTASDWLDRRPWVGRIISRRVAGRIIKSVSDSQELSALVCPQGAWSIQIMESLKRMRKVRYITWLMDDHVVARRNGSWDYRDGLREVFGKHLSEASTVFVISPKLGELYQREFGVQSEVLCGPADPQGQPVYEPPSGKGPLTIGYFGRVWEWQLKEVVGFASALRVGKEILHVYSPDSVLPESLRLPTVELKGALSKEAVLGRMRDYDAVLIPMGFGEAQRNLTEFNIATKMSECLASGTVTIVFGPPYAAMVRFLQPTGAACLLMDPTLADWPQVAANLRDRDYRRWVLDAARELVLKELSTEVMRGRWKAALQKLAIKPERCN